MRKVAAVLLVLVVLVAAAFVIDTVSRDRAERVVAAELREAIPGLQGADVSITGTPFLTQLGAGRFRLVHVTADSMLAGGLQLRDVDATLTEVTREQPTAGTLTVTATVSPDALAGALPGFAYTIEGEALVATLPDAPLAAVIEPTAAGDRIALEVTELRFGGVAVAPEDLPLGLGDAFLDLSVPVALPTGLRLDGVTVADSVLRVLVSGRDVPLTAPQ